LIAEKTVRITKAKTLREPLRVAKPKIETNVASYLGESGALPQKWEEYEQNDEIGEDIKDIIYSVGFANRFPANHPIRQLCMWRRNQSYAAS